MGAVISKWGSRPLRQPWEARAAEAERVLRETQLRVLRLESEMRLELQARVGQQRHAEEGDLLRGTSRSPDARVAGAERAENREPSEERLMPHHVRTQPEEKPTTQGDAVAMGAEGTTEVGPHL
jgi:hypothetical protein